MFRVSWRVMLYVKSVIFSSLPRCKRGAIKENFILKGNKYAMLMENNGKSSCSKRSTHLNVRYFHVKDVVDTDEIEIACCPTELIMGDFFYKTCARHIVQEM